MSIRVVSIITISLLLLACPSSYGQVGEGTQSPPPEQLPPGTEITPDGALPFVPAKPSCKKPHAAVKVLPVTQSKPISVLVPREVITTRKGAGYEIAYRQKTCTITEMVLKPVEVMREVPCTVMKPCTVTDPHTGCTKTILKPVATTKIQKDVVFQSVPVEKKLTAQVPYLKKIEEPVVQRNILLEYKTEMEPRVYAVPVPDHVAPDRYYITPKPPCIDPPPVHHH